MSSYTAQLFQSLQASAAAQPPASADSPSAGALGAGGGAGADEYNAVIEFQRTQIAQLRARTSAMEQQLTQYREKVQSYEQQGGRGAADATSPGAAYELARLRAETSAQAAELTKLRDERTGLMLKLHEQQKRIDELKGAAERPPPPPPPPPPAASGGTLLAELSQRNASGIRKGAGVREAALDAPAAAVALSPTPWNASQPPLVLDGSAPAGPATDVGSVTTPTGPAETQALGFPISGSESASTAASLATVTDASAGLTASLLQKQEQLKQQEALLIALKQAQGQTRSVAQQAQAQAQAQQRHQALQQALQQQQLVQQQQAALQLQQQLQAQQQAQAPPGGYSAPGLYGGGGSIPPAWGAGAGAVSASSRHPSLPYPAAPAASHGAGGGAPYGYGGSAGVPPPPPLPPGFPPPPPAPSHQASQSMRFAQAQQLQSQRMPWAVAAASSSVSAVGTPLGHHGHGPPHFHPHLAPPHPGVPPPGGAYSAPPPPPPPYGSSSGPGTPVHFGSPAPSPGGSPAPVNPEATKPPSSPKSGGRVSQRAAPEPPTPAGWTVYHHPPKGTPWPDNMPFYQPLVEVGIPFVKHGRKGLPHRRIMWLDISDARTPVLVWQDGDRRDPDRVKDKDRLPLVEIVDIRAGQASDVLERSGKAANADLYMVFAGEARSLDVEAPTPEGRDWLFRRFADLFQAYSIAMQEGLSGDKVTLRVMKLMDAGVPVKAGAAAAAARSAPPPPALAIGSPAPSTRGGFAPAGAAPFGSPHGSFYGGGPAGSPGASQPAPTPIRMSSLGPGYGASPAVYGGYGGAAGGR